MILTICLNPVLQKTLLFSKPVEKNSIHRAVSHRLDVSGKGINVSRVLVQMGFSVVHVTQLGGIFSKQFKHLACKDGIKLDYVKTKSNIRFCYTIIDGAVTELVEEGSTVDYSIEKKIIRTFMKHIRNKPSCVVISGSKASGFSNELYPSMVYTCLLSNIPVIADYRGSDLQKTLDAILPLKEKAKLLTIKPNAQELCTTFSCDETEEGIKRCIDQLYKTYGCSCIITQGENPVLVHDASGFSSYSINSSNKVLNTTGCGDAFTAGFASIISMGGGMQEAMYKGLECGMKNAETMRPGSIF